MTPYHSVSRISISKELSTSGAEWSLTDDRHQTSLECSVIKAMETSEDKHALQSLKPLSRTLGQAIGIAFIEPEVPLSYPPITGLASPLILSPTQSISATSSPISWDDIMYSPGTPVAHFGRATTDELLTPATPPTPTTPDRLLDQSPVSRVIKSLRVRSPKSVVKADMLALHDAALVEKKVEDLRTDEKFRPKKLIRNLTKELQALSSANVLAAEGQYRLSPCFDFRDSPKDTIKIPPLKSNVWKQYNLRSTDNTSSPDTKRVDTSTKITVAPEARVLSTKLRSLEHIVSFKVWTRLAELSGKCVASMPTKKNMRCNYNRASQSTDMILRELSKCDVSVDNAKFWDLVGQLVDATQCYRHCKMAYSKIKGLGNIALRLSELSKKDLEDFRAWVHTISTRDEPGSHHSIQHHVKPVNETHVRQKVPMREPAPSPARAEPLNSATAPSSSPDFAPYLPKSSNSLDVSGALREIITKPLGPQALKSGFIYVFWEQGKFGKVKIGRTKDLASRLTQWNTSCGRIHAYHPSSERDLIEIPHVSRVERLMHIELKDHRMQRYCERCNKTHIEWFQVEETLALQVFLKWKCWIEQEPYAVNSESGEWELRPEMEDSLAAVCQPVVLDKAEQTAPFLRAVKKGKRVSRPSEAGRGRRSPRFS